MREMVMGGENDHTTLLAMGRQMGLQLGHRLFIQSGEGLVENPQRRRIEV